jgi:hypothetical protein
VSGWEELQRERSCSFLVLRATAEVVGSLPYRWFNELEWDIAASKDGFECAARSAVFESARRTLSGHRLRTLNSSAIGTVHLNPSLQREHVDTLLGATTDNRNVDGIDVPRRGAIAELDDGETTTNARIATKDLHLTPPSSRSF